ncbi:hypothetical protein B0H10DRAFT_2055908 [Mycena sp. CBHHK59/15]|nr:hypothetical protein B0H10DRAFT_2066688 [Mycena sp. CBHHK59/15]KAJ6611540.1 hypothetical protein B0H10DRAFT_2055908 [Mycena sp. CBHHK59/15]
MIRARRWRALRTLHYLHAPLLLLMSSPPFRPVSSGRPFISARIPTCTNPCVPHFVADSDGVLGQLHRLPHPKWPQH